MVDAKNIFQLVNILKLLKCPFNLTCIIVEVKLDVWKSLYNI